MWRCGPLLAFSGCWTMEVRIGSNKPPEEDLPLQEVTCGEVWCWKTVTIDLAELAECFEWNEERGEWLYLGEGLAGPTELSQCSPAVDPCVITLSVLQTVDSCGCLDGSLEMAEQGECCGGPVMNESYVNLGENPAEGGVVPELASNCPSVALSVGESTSDEDLSGFCDPTAERTPTPIGECGTGARILSPGSSQLQIDAARSEIRITTPSATSVVRVSGNASLGASRMVGVGWPDPLSVGSVHSEDFVVWFDGAVVRDDPTRFVLPRDTVFAAFGNLSGVWTYLQFRTSTDVSGVLDRVHGTWSMVVKDVRPERTVELRLVGDIEENP
jgi:hypothetical protein